MTVLHLLAKACQTSVLSVGPTWPWWKYFKGDVWPSLIALRLAVAVPLIIKILSVCIEQTAGMCIFFSLLCTLLGWRMFMAGPETLWSMLACMPSKIDFLICGWQLGFEKRRQSWYGSCQLALLHLFGSWCLEKPTGFYGNTSFYTGKNSGLGLWGHCLRRD